MARQLTPDQRADRLASRQDGALTRAQALACGLTNDQIKHRIGTGRWLLRGRGVYVIAGAPPTWRRDIFCACAAGPAGTVSSHLSGGALFSWNPPSPLPHVTVRPGASTRSKLALVHRAPLQVIDRTLVGHVPVTTPARTLVDIAAIVPREQLIEIADNALCSKLVTPDAVAAALARAERAPGRRGGGLLRSVLEDWDPLIRPGSPAELRTLRLLRQWGFPTPVKQHVITDAAGRFVARVDLAWVPAKVAGEYDSVRFHGPTRWRRDEPRYDAIDGAGWTSVSIDKADLLPGERRLRDDLERAFRRQQAA